MASEQSNGFVFSPEICEELIRVGVALSEITELKALLSMILTRAREFTSADGGTLFLLEEGMLRAEVAECQTFVDRLGPDAAADLFQQFSVKSDKRSICGRVAVTREMINIPDVRLLPRDDPNGVIQYDDSFDREHDYETRSLAAVPMLDREGRVVGVLELINARQDGVFTAFQEEALRIVQSLASQAAVTIRNVQLTESLRRAHLKALHVLSIAAEWRDRETANHIRRVAHYSCLLGRKLGMSETDLDLLMKAAPMHDVGKLGIPDAILQKPGKFTPDERKIMEKHVVIGANMLSNQDSPLMRMCRSIALTHHEKWDGTGYPRQLPGEDIPLVGRLVAVADVYDALSSKRCYKDAFPHDKVVSIMEEGRGEHFDPKLIDLMLENLEEMREIGKRFEDTEEDFEQMQDYDHAFLDED